MIKKFVLLFSLVLPATATVYAVDLDGVKGSLKKVGKSAKEEFSGLVVPKSTGTTPSPYEKAGLKEGDQVMAVDGTEVKDKKSMLAAKDKVLNGKYSSIKVKRPGQAEPMMINK